MLQAPPSWRLVSCFHKHNSSDRLTYWCFIKHFEISVGFLDLWYQNSPVFLLVLFLVNLKTILTAIFAPVWYGFRWESFCSNSGYCHCFSLNLGVPIPLNLGIRDCCKQSSACELISLIWLYAEHNYLFSSLIPNVHTQLYLMCGSQRRIRWNDGRLNIFSQAYCYFAIFVNTDFTCLPMFGGWVGFSWMFSFSSFLTPRSCTVIIAYILVFINL